MDRVTPPPKIMLCLHPNCHGEFYVPLDVNDWATCPHNDAHPVAIYGNAEAALRETVATLRRIHVRVLLNEGLDSEWVEQQTKLMLDRHGRP